MNEPSALKSGERTFHKNDRVKCFVIVEKEDWIVKKWVKGTIEKFFYFKEDYPKEFFEPMFEYFEQLFGEGKSGLVLLEEKESEKGTRSIFISKDHVGMSIRTDEKISPDPNDLFEGYGWNCGGLYVIFENEEEYDPSPKEIPADEQEDLPF